ncbi:NAD(P)-dependent oxidoreductase [Amycolatopsis sp. NPDC051372]|uniref:NAD(P)-dependent oxidoreductase n=1 Tax=unclassified Amycolatopsis TaxID=2618356 RepID=UPI00342BBB06
MSEHVVMMILSLVRNYLPAHQRVLDGGGNIADCVARSYDLEAMDVGTVAAGRIGTAVLRRLKPFDVRVHYTDRHRSRRSGQIKRGAYLVNTARGKICDRDAVVRALESGQLAGYAGDVWFPQPAPQVHRWRTMPHHGMTPHTSGTSLSAQARYAAGTREILECYFAGHPIRDEYLIVEGGSLAGTGKHSYSSK